MVFIKKIHTGKGLRRKIFLALERKNNGEVNAIKEKGILPRSAAHRIEWLEFKTFTSKAPSCKKGHHPFVRNC